jgi:tripartite-type tricarboxylate transporter receptor subunit TctC
MRARLFAALAGTALGFSDGALAQDVDFAGETIEMIVPYGPGGGSSLHAQLVARMLEQELPGNPTIRMRNIEGGASVRGLNRFAREAEPDGRMFAALGTASYYSYILGSDTVRYPLPEFIPILASPSGYIAYGRRDAGLTGDPLHDIDQLRQNRPLHAGDDPASADMPVIFCYDLLGIKVKGVWGVSRGEARQAFLRGETQVNHDTVSVWESDLQPMLDDGTMVPLFTMGFRNPDGTIGRDPSWPDVPSCPELYELVHGEPLGGVMREIFDVLYAVRMSVAKTIVLPPGTPDEIVAAYDAAIARMLERPEIDEPSAQLELGGYPQLTGDGAREGHRIASQMSDAARDLLFSWLREEWDAHF